MYTLSISHQGSTRLKHNPSFLLKMPKKKKNGCVSLPCTSLLTCPLDSCQSASLNPESLTGSKTSSSGNWTTICLNFLQLKFEILNDVKLFDMPLIKGEGSYYYLHLHTLHYRAWTKKYSLETFKMLPHPKSKFSAPIWRAGNLLPALMKISRWFSCFQILLPDSVEWLLPSSHSLLPTLHLLFPICEFVSLLTTHRYFQLGKDVELFYFMTWGGKIKHDIFLI